MVICSTIANGIRNRSQERKVPMVEGIKASSKKLEWHVLMDRVLNVSGFAGRSMCGYRMSILIVFVILASHLGHKKCQNLTIPAFPYNQTK